MPELYEKQLSEAYMTSYVIIGGDNRKCIVKIQNES